MSLVVIGKCHSRLTAKDVASEPVDDDHGPGDWNIHFDFLANSCESVRIYARDKGYGMTAEWR